MMKKAFVLSAFLTGLFTLSALAQVQQSADRDDRNTLVKFDGGIGVLPVASAVGPGPTATVVNRNIVRGVQPAGQIWVISALKATVKTDGDIHVVGRGLLLGGGNLIGFTANASVFATLICEPTAPFTEHSTDPAGVPLQPDGDFRIDDVLSPLPPADCVSPVLLIRVTGANPGWFAAGIPKQD
jgi:hypothetical protein